ncbi:hypothetical protein ACFVWN_19315 [Nocardiopsis flavescens]|uniref:hypothetical protein n=1 Tax=Nocardiopsis flavescens TaxID=758803 RepID=UPI00365DBF42
MRAVPATAATARSRPARRRRPRARSSFGERRLRDVRVIGFRSGARTWELAVVTIDVPVVTAALREAESWSGPTPPE